MSCMIISSYPRLQGGKEAPEDYSVATTFGDVDLIIINKVPAEQYKMIESWMQEIIEHETLHILLHRLGENNASHGLDAFFPYVSALWNFRTNPVRFIKKRRSLMKHE